jgi:hypothetical protein
MAAPTSIEVSVDNTEYSRYESSVNTITATIVITGGAPYSSEDIRVDLVKARRNRDVVVSSVLQEITSVTSPHTFIVTFYLPEMVDQDQLSLVRHGKYFVRATSVASPLVIGESLDFNIRVITVEKFKADYLFGIRLNSTEIKYVKYQPTNITGVTITEVSKTSKPGFGVLSYTYNATGPVRSISWNGGTAVTITGVGNYLLKGGASGPLASLGLSTDYIVIKVTSLIALPTSNKTDDILIEEKTISDDVIADYLDKAIAYTENDFLQLYIEPTVLTTDVNPLDVLYSTQSPITAPLYSNYDYDFIVRPLSYIASKSSWITINTNFNQLLRVDSLFGVVANTRTIDIDLQWVTTSINGMIQLIPLNASYNQYFLSLIWNGAFHSQGQIPSFWHFVLLAGLRDVTADIRDYISKKAAIDLLGLLGASFRPGLGGLSVSRDGVSESTSFVNTQKYGIYNSLIGLYMDQLKKLEERLRATYRGMPLLVV